MFRSPAVRLGTYIVCLAVWIGAALVYPNWSGWVYMQRSGSNYRDQQRTDGIWLNGRDPGSGGDIRVVVSISSAPTRLRRRHSLRGGIGRRLGMVRCRRRFAVSVLSRQSGQWRSGEWLNLVSSVTAGRCWWRLADMAYRAVARRDARGGLRGIQSPSRPGVMVLRRCDVRRAFAVHGWGDCLRAIPTLWLADSYGSFIRHLQRPRIRHRGFSRLDPDGVRRLDTMATRTTSVCGGFGVGQSPCPGWPRVAVTGEETKAIQRFERLSSRLQL